MSTPLNLVVFDCDGTIADSQHMIVEAMVTTFVRHDLAAPPAAEVRSIVGLSLSEALTRLVPAGSHAKIGSLVESYKETFGDLVSQPRFSEPLFENAREVIQDLASDPGIVLGIATGKSQRGVRRLLQREILDDLFATIQTADDAPSKPHPGMLYQAMAAVGADAERTAMVGDTTYDIEMAVNAGVVPVGVAWGYHPPDALTEAGADYIAPDFRSLQSFLASEFSAAHRAARG